MKNKKKPFERWTNELLDNVIYVQNFEIQLHVYDSRNIVLYSQWILHILLTVDP